MTSRIRRTQPIALALLATLALAGCAGQGAGEKPADSQPAATATVAAEATDSAKPTYAKRPLPTELQSTDPSYTLVDFYVDEPIEAQTWMYPAKPVVANWVGTAATTLPLGAIEAGKEIAIVAVDSTGKELPVTLTLDGQQAELKPASSNELRSYNEFHHRMTAAVANGEVQVAPEAGSGTLRVAVYVYDAAKK